MKKQHGFTIIELIVVIAIIAVLAGIVLVNVTQYINKSKDAAIKADMGGFTTCAATALSGNSGYTNDNLQDSGVCKNFMDAVNKVTSKIDAENGNATGSYYNFGTPDTLGWCYDAALNDGTYWCVDSTGYAGPPYHFGSCSNPDSNGKFNCANTNY